MKAKCSTCGGDTPFEEQTAAKDAKCTNCWEVEKRIEDYLKSEKGDYTL